MRTTTAAFMLTDCTHLPGWDLVRWDGRLSAGNYATLSALLAGFSLSGLLWISSSPPADRTTKSSAVVGVWASLVPLVLATLLFGETAGEFDCARAAMEGPTASLSLTVGAVTLFIALGQLLRRVFDDNADQFARLVGWVAIVVGAASVYQGNTTMMTLLDGERWERSVPGIIQVGLLLATLAVAGFWRTSHKGLGLFVYTVGIGIAMFVLAFLIAVQQQPPAWFPDLIAWTRVLLWSGFIVFAAQLLRIDAVDANSAA